MITNNKVVDLTIEKCRQIFDGILTESPSSGIMQVVQLEYIRKHNLQAALFFDFPFPDMIWEVLSGVFSQHGDALYSVNIDDFYAHSSGTHHAKDLLGGNYICQPQKLMNIFEGFTFTNRITASSDQRVLVLNKFSDFVIVIANEKVLEEIFQGYIKEPQAYLKDQIASGSIPSPDQKWVQEIINYYSPVSF